LYFGNWLFLVTEPSEHFSHEAATVNEEFPNNLANRAPDFVGQA
jgi:hypothetical protein